MHIQSLLAGFSGTLTIVEALPLTTNHRLDHVKELALLTTAPAAKVINAHICATKVTGHAAHRLGHDIASIGKFAGHNPNPAKIGEFAGKVAKTASHDTVARLRRKKLERQARRAWCAALRKQGRMAKKQPGWWEWKPTAEETEKARKFIQGVNEKEVEEEEAVCQADEENDGEDIPAQEGEERQTEGLEGVDAQSGDVEGFPAQEDETTQTEGLEGVDAQSAEEQN